MEDQKFKGGVTVMLSYDYCHFEFCLSSDEEITLQEINEIRKRAQRLADESVRQYKEAKCRAVKRLELEYERPRLENEVAFIKREKPESEWSEEDKAKIKALDDDDYWSQYDYDYDDDELAGIAF